MAKLLLVTGDLMLISRLERVAEVCQLTKMVANNAQQAIDNCDGEVAVAIVDLQAPGLVISNLVAELKQSSPHLPIVAAGPHVHALKLEQAREAGCTEVVSRGQLDREAEAIVQRLL